MQISWIYLLWNFFIHFVPFCSGGIFCDAVGILCGGTAIGVSGAIYREGHTFVLTHGVTADNAAGSLGANWIICYLFSLKFSLTWERTHKMLRNFSKHQFLHNKVYNYTKKMHLDFENLAKLVSWSISSFKNSLHTCSASLCHFLWKE